MSPNLLISEGAVPAHEQAVEGVETTWPMKQSRAKGSVFQCSGSRIHQDVSFVGNAITLDNRKPFKSCGRPNPKRLLGTKSRDTSRRSPPTSAAYDMVSPVPNSTARICDPPIAQKHSIQTCKLKPRKILKSPISLLHYL